MFRIFFRVIVKDHTKLLIGKSIQYKQIYMSGDEISYIYTIYMATVLAEG